MKKINGRGCIVEKCCVPEKRLEFELMKIVDDCMEAQLQWKIENAKILFNKEGEA